MSIIKALLESEAAVKDNISVTSAINELANIQESCEYLPDKIMYTAESVPVFKVQQGRKDMYVIECDYLCKLMECQECDVCDALSSVKSVLASSDPEVKFDSMAILVKPEDIEQIEETCYSDPSKIGARTEQVMGYSKFLKSILSEGVNLLVDRK